ncbi:uncharacterized protein EAE97_003684 [Botrytis byssoidea]|uniref:Uncharacterized protein n=1 Tax=Botrytis byssoidea TaxID=139641 RepID=A0A9P5M6U7_9HELO|nr:uncharacterized protein EAE97_003684 [Botrytis byssoidea]KAF7948273.1 hypothetical protein EAE97_003684 [Botrytis byssoidea]
MILECKSNLFCECAGLEKIYPLLDSNINQDIFSISERAVLDRWLNIVGEYRTLALTKHDDRAIAILGVARICQGRLKSKYLAGLWETDIARALLWDASLQSGRIWERLYEGTEMSGVTNDSRTALRLGSIRVKAAYISATLIYSHRNRGPGRSGLFETSLLAAEMLGEVILIMWSSMDLDISDQSSSSSSSTSSSS